MIRSEPSASATPTDSNEERFRALIAAMSTFVWVADASGQFSAPQAGWERYTGHDFARHGGMGWIEDVYPEDRTTVEEVWNRAVQTKSWYEVEWRCWHGATQTWRRCLTRGVPVLRTDGSVREWIGAVTDIENRLRPREAAAQAWLQAALAAGGLALWEWVPSTNEARWTAEYYQIYGARPGTTREELDAQMHPEDFKNIQDVRAEALRTGRVALTYRIIRPDREVRWLRSIGAAIEGSHPMKIAGCIVDVTELMRANLELANANAQLELFNIAASHDLREPLRQISLFAELLIARLGNSADRDVAEWLEFCREGARRLHKLLEDLRAYTSVGTSADLRPSSVNARQAFDVAVKNCARAIAQSQAKITPGDLPVVRADTSLLILVFQNLLANAIKYRGKEPPEIRVSAVRVDQWCRFEVADNGIGIAPPYHESIFGVFKRLHHRSEYEGSGMGLAICQKIVRRYGGTIWVESEPGQGARFYFTLPAA